MLVRFEVFVEPVPRVLDSQNIAPQVDIERVGLLRSIVSSMDDPIPTVWMARDRLLDMWRRYCSMMGQEVRVEGMTGRAIDLRSDGALLIETASGQIVPVLSGDVESAEMR